MKQHFAVIARDAAKRHVIDVFDLVDNLSFLDRRNRFRRISRGDGDVDVADDLESSSNAAGDFGIFDRTDLRELLAKRFADCDSKR